MKSSYKNIFIAIIIMTAALIDCKPVAAKQTSISFQVFYDDLSPYGQWVNYPSYGYVWIPAGGGNFVPYSTGGYWIWTDYGWTWASNYSWGWAPFHYGRWDYDPFYGWFWVPGMEWGPAWVAWRRSPGYYGWAPLSPGVSINVSVQNNYYGPRDRWIFVQEQHIASREANKYYAPRNNNETIINKSTIINKTYEDRSRNTTYASGPDRQEVQRVTGTQVKSVAIEENSKPGQSLKNERLSIYRPAVTKASRNQPEPAPKNVTELKNVRSGKNESDRPVNRHNDPSHELSPTRNNTNANPNNNARPVPNKSDKSVEENQRIWQSQPVERQPENPRHNRQNNQIQKNADRREEQMRNTPAEINRTTPNPVPKENHQARPNNQPQPVNPSPVPRQQQPQKQPSKQRPR